MQNFVVRYGIFSNVRCFHSQLENVAVGDQVIIRTDRGQELGEIIGSLPTGAQVPGTGEILRPTSFEDRRRLQRIATQDVPLELEFCRQCIRERGPKMKLVSAEHLFDGSKIIFYFSAEGRVDFRELVKDLAKEYQTRIELRQIGVRDEARMVGQWGHCGRVLCCRSFMKDLEPVTMKMAKSQKATLDPAKISGLCGRLMCCLRYEDEIYEKLKATLPKKGSYVNFSQGRGEVIDYDILKQQVRIETEDGRVLTVSADQIRKKNSGRHRREKKT